MYLPENYMPIEKRDYRRRNIGMGKVLHIKDAYFKIPEKCKDDFACAIILLGIYLQKNNLTVDDMNKVYEGTDSISDFLMDDEKQCLVSCSVENMSE